MSTNGMGSARKGRRVLAPAQKWGVFLAVSDRSMTQREAAAKWQVDRSTVTSIMRAGKEGALAALSAKPGRPGKSPERVALEEAQHENETLRATVTAQAVELHLYRGKSHGSANAWLTVRFPPLILTNRLRLIGV